MARPLPQRPPEDDPTPEPKLEVVPEPARLDEPVEVEEKDPYDAVAAITQDPLKLYVRQIGDGPLLTPQEERELARRKDAGDEAGKRPPPPTAPAPAADAAGGARARPAQGRGRRGGQAPPDRVQPPPRDVDHAELHEGRRPAARPDPGGQPLPDPRRRKIGLKTP